MACVCDDAREQSIDHFVIDLLLRNIPYSAPQELICIELPSWNLLELIH